MNKKSIYYFILLHISIFVYSMVGLFSKSAAKYSFLSWDYIKYYLGVIIVLGIYAILWQQVIKKVPLNVAYANKAVSVLWGIIWGIIIWKERIDPKQLIGVIFIILGVVLVGLENDRVSD